MEHQRQPEPEPALEDPAEPEGNVAAMGDDTQEMDALKLEAESEREHERPADR